MDKEIGVLETWVYKLKTLFKVLSDGFILFVFDIDPFDVLDIERLNELGNLFVDIKPLVHHSENWLDSIFLERGPVQTQQWA